MDLDSEYAEAAADFHPSLFVWQLIGGFEKEWKSLAPKLGACPRGTVPLVRNQLLQVERRLLRGWSCT